jgi:hypothetical protein
LRLYQGSIEALLRLYYGFGEGGKDGDELSESEVTSSVSEAAMAADPLVLQAQ